MRFAPFLIASALIFSASPALAATKPAAKAAPKSTASAPAAKPGAGGDGQVQSALLYLKVLISGLQSDKVDEPVKAALVGCLYDNSLGKISQSMDKVIAENSGKIHKDNPSEVLSVMARICGYQPAQGAPGTAPAPAATPTPTTTTPGR
jgi:hypothetical protein